MMIKKIVPLTLSQLCAAAAAQTQTPSEASGTTAAPAPPRAVTGNLNLVSDYRFRSMAQSWGLPAVQGGIDYTHASGI
jgi:uncharacterized protein (TIGR02001 family)